MLPFVVAILLPEWLFGGVFAPPGASHVRQHSYVFGGSVSATVCLRNRVQARSPVSLSAPGSLKSLPFLVQACISCLVGFLAVALRLTYPDQTFLPGLCSP